MIPLRVGIVLVFWMAAVLLPAATAAAPTDEERLVSRLAGVSAEVDRRSAAFMREILPRQAALRLNELTTPENLVSHEGRIAIRSGYRSFATLLDEIESFARAEEAWVVRALADATSGLPVDMASEAQRAFQRGRARSAARHAALRAAQRESIKTSFELLDVIDGAPGGAILANRMLRLPDRETGVRVSRLLSELIRLEMEEQKAEREILERRGAPAQTGP